MNRKTGVMFRNGSGVGENHVFDVRGWNVWWKMDESRLGRWDVATNEAFWALGDRFV